MMSLKKIEPYHIFLLLLYLLIGFAVVKQLIKDESRRKNHAETTAVVYEFESVRRRHYEDYYYNYSFKVNGITYEGRKYFDPNSEDIQIGDTIVIEYDSLNPSNSKPIQLSDN